MSPPIVKTQKAIVKTVLLDGYQGHITGVELVGEIFYQGSKPLSKCGFNFSQTENNLPGSSVFMLLGAPCEVSEYRGLALDLSPGMEYFYIAGASNSDTVGYGEIKSFVVPVIPPTVVTSSASDIGSSSITLSGEVTHAGIAIVTERGIEYSPDADFPAGSTLKSQGDLDLEIWGTGPFSVNITDLDAGTLYYYRAFAISDAGESKGDTKNFSTQ